MTHDAHQKVKASHLKRSAYLYVRQSTLRQVLENTESTQRQYALRQQAVALGWPLDRVIVIDTDLGQSGASAADREGFQRLVTEVSLARAGIVLGLEVSRLARMKLNRGARSLVWRDHPPEPSAGRRRPASSRFGRHVLRGRSASPALSPSRVRYSPIPRVT